MIKILSELGINGNLFTLTKSIYKNLQLMYLMVRDWSLPTENWGKGKDVSLPSPSEHPTQCDKKKK